LDFGRAAALSQGSADCAHENPLTSSYSYVRPGGAIAGPATPWHRIGPGGAGRSLADSPRAHTSPPEP
jgi:hypothetical protein